jgi:O-antigen/teichoic acid export membrane protein
MGEKMLLSFTTVILFSIYFYSWQFRVFTSNFKDAAGLWDKDKYKPFIGTITNVILNFILIKLIGINGVLISTIVIMIFIFFLIETLVVYKYIFELSPIKFILNNILRTIHWVFIGIILFFSSQFLKIDNYIDFIFSAFIYIFLSNIIYIILNLNTNELKGAFRYGKKIIQKKQYFKV